MPAADVDLEDDQDPAPAPAPSLPSRLPFPPITTSHILNCSVHSWHPRYRSLTPTTRLVPLSAAFVDYLRADGIVLPPEPHAQRASQDDDGWGDADEDEEETDPSAAWPGEHAAVGAAITALGGHVHPKLNWSAPKDATWIAATNSMDCTAPNDVYLLLKSSDFVAHDLDLAFDGCTDGTPAEDPGAEEHSNGEAADRSHGVQSIPYLLALRKTVPALLTSMEFRCFVRRRRLLGSCQRELKHYPFMAGLVPTLQTLIAAFFERRLRRTFPDESFVFDVYVPRLRPGGRVWLIDINPWAPRTDPLLFSWLELLEMPDPLEAPAGMADEIDDDMDEGVAHLQLASDGGDPTGDPGGNATVDALDAESDVEEVGWPPVRLVGRDDPENYSINSPLYSAHKLPMDVVAAGMDGQGGIRDFLSRWTSTTAAAENGSMQSDSDEE